ncbi:Serine/threonine-protein kinase ppk15 [Smittium mucronatum]|uniref:Serine/threonine-protein kinase ppk15 n=1 Tax=Smittium mucronatum TaxID=133383 RepID=A0A1R0GY34_9FUNG|nr:Serine/threonine-protein kinase ppk15 [Smittium mucronatum]
MSSSSTNFEVPRFQSVKKSLPNHSYRLPDPVLSLQIPTSSTNDFNRVRNHTVSSSLTSISSSFTPNNMLATSSRAHPIAHPSFASDKNFLDLNESSHIVNMNPTMPLKKSQLTQISSETPFIHSNLHYTNVSPPSSGDSHFFNNKLQTRSFDYNPSFHLSPPQTGSRNFPQSFSPQSFFSKETPHLIPIPCPNLLDSSGYSISPSSHCSHVPLPSSDIPSIPPNPLKNKNSSSPYPSHKSPNSSQSFFTPLIKTPHSDFSPNLDSSPPDNHFLPKDPNLNNTLYQQHPKNIPTRSTPLNSFLYSNLPEPNSFSSKILPTTHNDSSVISLKFNPVIPQLPQKSPNYLSNSQSPNISKSVHQFPYIPVLLPDPSSTTPDNPSFVESIKKNVLKLSDLQISSKHNQGLKIYPMSANLGISDSDFQLFPEYNKDSKIPLEIDNPNPPSTSLTINSTAQNDLLNGIVQPASHPISSLKNNDLDVYQKQYLHRRQSRLKSINEARNRSFKTSYSADSKNTNFTKNSNLSNNRKNSLISPSHILSQGCPPKKSLPPEYTIEFSKNFRSVGSEEDIPYSSRRFSQKSPKYCSFQPVSKIPNLLKLTVDLVNTYEIVKNSHENSEISRFLTEPNKGVHNFGYDNANFNLILQVSDVIGSNPGQQYQIISDLGSGTFGQVVKYRVSGSDPKRVSIFDLVLAQYRSTHKSDAYPLDVHMFSDFLSKVLKIDQDERYTPIEALEHPFIKDFNQDFQPENRELSDSYSVDNLYKKIQNIHINSPDDFFPNSAPNKTEIPLSQISSKFIPKSPDILCASSSASNTSKNMFSPISDASIILMSDCTIESNDKPITGSDESFLYESQKSVSSIDYGFDSLTGSSSHSISGSNHSYELISCNTQYECLTSNSALDSNSFQISRPDPYFNFSSDFSQINGSEMSFFSSNSSLRSDIDSKILSRKHRSNSHVNIEDSNTTSENNYEDLNSYQAKTYNSSGFISLAGSNVFESAESVIDSYANFHGDLPLHANKSVPYLSSNLSRYNESMSSPCLPKSIESKTYFKRPISPNFYLTSLSRFDLGPDEED